MFEVETRHRNVRILHIKDNDRSSTYAPEVQPTLFSGYVSGTYGFLKPRNTSWHSALVSAASIECTACNLTLHAAFQLFNMSLPSDGYNRLEMFYNS